MLPGGALHPARSAYGTIRVTGEPGRYVALAWFRDLDGKARQVERRGGARSGTDCCPASDLGIGCAVRDSNPEPSGRESRPQSCDAVSVRAGQRWSPLVSIMSDRALCRAMG
ncbi:hypothetical protein GCM10023203_31740 [Actinomycetospora straminea]|uniref:Uncharacterized protein n=1 Tax=Actinomycetospora straminea TaxID=663607 RepID=A0ABP9ER11_9PSEU